MVAEGPRHSKPGKRAEVTNLRIAAVALVLICMLLPLSSCSYIRLPAMPSGEPTRAQPAQKAAPQPSQPSQPSQKKAQPARPQLERKGITVTVESAEFGRDGSVIMLEVINDTKSQIEYAADEFFLSVDEDEVLTGFEETENEAPPAPIAPGKRRSITVHLPAVSQRAERGLLMCEFTVDGSSKVEFELDISIR